MLVLRIGVVACAVLLGLLSLRPTAPVPYPTEADLAQPRDAWEKLKQQIQSHRNLHPKHVASHPVSEKRTFDHASAPQATEADLSWSEPVQEQVETAQDTAVPAAVKPASLPGVQKHEAQRTAPGEPNHAAHSSGGRRRLVRITTYENGRPVRVRSFTVPSSASRDGPRHKRFRLACPNGRCRPLNAAMFMPGGAFN
jgi:hypothetical protein